MMKTIQNAASGIFVLAVGFLALISILGVWDFFSRDVITKSFETLGLLAIVAIVVIIAGRFVDKGNDPSIIYVPNPIFKIIRQATLVVLIISAVLLAFLGVCTIWDIISDKQILYKSLTSLGILAFSSFVIVITCLEREDSPMLKKGGRMSGGSIFLIIFLIYVFFMMFGLFR